MPLLVTEAAAHAVVMYIYGGSYSPAGYRTQVFKVDREARTATPRPNRAAVFLEAARAPAPGTRSRSSARRCAIEAPAGAGPWPLSPDLGPRNLFTAHPRQGEGGAQSGRRLRRQVCRE